LFFGLVSLILLGLMRAPAMAPQIDFLGHVEQQLRPGLVAVGHQPRRPRGVCNAPDLGQSPEPARFREPFRRVLGHDGAVLTFCPLSKRPRVRAGKRS
jgi:hypothetical protein